MGESAVGALVPSVKTEPSLDPAEEPQPVTPALLNTAAEDAGPSDMEKDSLCPICMQIISDAFLTACGHSFCYMCIVTHLRNKSDCPCCGHYLTPAQIFPNFLLDKLLRRTCARQIAKSASPFEHLRQALQQTGS